MTDPAPLPAEHIFIFLHMPKAGGSTLQRVVDRQFRGRDPDPDALLRRFDLLAD